MPSYWDRLAQIYTSIGEASFWLKHRLRIIGYYGCREGLSGRVLDACCGGGQLVVELRQREVDVYGVDLSPNMTAGAQAKLAQAGLAPTRIARANVMRMPFADGTFDAVVATGSIALFKPEDQRKAITELTRVTRREVRFLESYEKQKGLYLGRILAFMFDGMRPIPQDVFQACGLDCEEQWDIFGGAFSYVHCIKREANVLPTDI